MNSIGVRQLKEFNDAKKEIEKIVRLSGPLSDEIYKSFEKNIAIIEPVDKKIADDFRAQIAKKKMNLDDQSFSKELLFDVAQKESQKTENKEAEALKSIFIQPSLQETHQSETLQQIKTDIVHKQPERIEFESDVPLTIEMKETPVISVTAPWTAPIVKSEPELRQTPVVSTQSAWSVPVSKKQQEQEKEQKKIQITQNVSKFENAVDQAEKNLNALMIDQNYVFQEKHVDFKNWNNAINNYSAELLNLKNVDISLYNQKIIKAQRIENLFAQKLVDYFLKNIQLLREKIETQLLILKNNEETKKTNRLIFSDPSEFNKKSYEYFFGDISKNLWSIPNTRKNLSWFKDNYQQLMDTYFNKGIKPFSDLLFEYHNTKKNLINSETSDQLKSKINGLKEDIDEYKQLLSNAYNAMFQFQKSLLSDDIKQQKALIEDNKKSNYFNYERHITFLNEADQTIKNKFWQKLWPETASSLI